MKAARRIGNLFASNDIRFIPAHSRPKDGVLSHAHSRPKDGVLRTPMEGILGRLLQPFGVSPWVPAFAGTSG
jgi:hypothetical protein